MSRFSPLMEDHMNPAESSAQGETADGRYVSGYRLVLRES
jgi:hypothetical protein